MPTNIRFPVDEPGLPLLLSVLVVVTFLIVTSFALAETTPGVAPSLTRALQDSAHPAWQDDGRLAVWVYFVDRGFTLAQQEAALAEAEARLPERTLKRRAKATAPGERRVDESDLPLNPDHLADAAATGAALRRQSRWLGAASYDATPAQVAALANLPCVLRVALVGVSPPTPEPGIRFENDLPPAPASPSNWTLDYGASLPGLEQANVPPVHELGFTGDGVVLAMLDSGFHMAHEALDHVPVLAAYDFVSDDSNVDNEPGDPANAHFHGTTVISVVTGFAPGHIIGPAYAASVILVRAEDPSVSITAEEDWWVAGLEWAEAQGADMVSSSLGFWTFHTAEELDGDTAASTIAADMAAARGLLVVNGAGNQGDTGFDVIVAPADGDSVVAVGAVEISGIIAGWSSSGPTYDGRIKPDVVALGSEVPVADPYDDFAYITSGGTSYSGPLVAGVAALILERAPFLTPIQVREALRTTASHSTAPDNDYGWGIIDALAAVYYWGPHIAHSELPDTEDTAGPYVFTATVDDFFSLDPLGPRLYYRLDGGPWLETPLVNQGGNDFAVSLPGFANGTVCEYYLEASDLQGLSARLPLAAPDQLFDFTVALDTTAPVVVHQPLGDQPLSTWPPYVVATVTDNFGVGDVTMSFTLNGGPVQGPFDMFHGPGDLFTRAFPLTAGELIDGDVISYTLTATDISQSANATQVGPHEIAVQGGGGQILVLDDNSGGEATTVAGWLNTAAFTVTTKAASSLGSGDLVGKLAVVLVSGGNPDPVGSATMRQLVEAWVAGGGRVLVTGGEIGFAALIFPTYPSFAANVLHAGAWRADAVGSLVAAPGQAGHRLLNEPETVVLPLTFGSTGESELDAIVPTTDADLVLETTTVAGAAGAIVFEENDTDPACQVVYYPFALSALADQQQARNLVVNALDHLLATGPPSSVNDGGGAVPQSTVLLDVAPNPFNSRVTLRWEMGQAAPVWLDIYDLRGRFVRRLLDGGQSFPTGPHSVVWDARDERGHDVSSGAYFLRLRADGVVWRGRMVLLR